MALSSDSREPIALLNSHGVEYLIIGAHSLAFHARPRFTGDLDILVRPTAENAAKILAVLNEFGFADLGMKASDFITPEQMFNLVALATGLTFLQASPASASRRLLRPKSRRNWISYRYPS